MFVNQEKAIMVKDPVCGMEIEEKDAFASRQVMRQTFYFCSQACVDKFDANPHAYMRHDEKPLASSVTTGVNPKLGNLRRVELPIVALDSAASVPIIERELKVATGVQEATVNFATKRAFIQFDAGHAGPHLRASSSRNGRCRLVAYVRMSHNLCVFFRAGC